jgi:GntR family transcriptional regulator
MTDPDATTAKKGAEVVRRQILDEIRDGTLKSGQRLGSERALADRFGVSRATLRLALDALERSDTVRRIPGRGGGTFVHQAKVERDLTTLAGLPEYLRRAGYVAGSRVISAALKPANAVAAEQLEVEDGTAVYDFLRVRLASGDPISLEHAILPADRFPGLLERPLGGSLMDVLRSEYGLKVSGAVERIEVVRAGRAEAHLLGVDAGAPLLSVERVAREESGSPYEFSVDLFRSDRTRIVTRSTGNSREVSHSEDGDAVEVVSL